MDQQEPGTFHCKHGRNVKLSSKATVACRVESCQDGVVFSEKPIPFGVVFQVKLVDNDLKWSGSVRLGFTTRCPEDISTVPTAALAMYNSADYWVLINSFIHHNGLQRNLNWNLDLLKNDQSVGCMVNKEGELRYFLDGVDQGVAWESFPTTKPLWGFVDVYGKTKKIRSEFSFVATVSMKENHQEKVNEIEKKFADLIELEETENMCLLEIKAPQQNLQEETKLVSAIGTTSTAAPGFKRADLNLAQIPEEVPNLIQSNFVPTGNEESDSVTKKLQKENARLQEELEKMKKHVAEENQKMLESHLQREELYKSQLQEMETSLQELKLQNVQEIEEKQRILDTHSQQEEQLRPQLQETETRLQEVQQELNEQRALVEEERRASAEERQRMLDTYSQQEEQLTMQIRAMEIRVQELEQQLEENARVQNLDTRRFTQLVVPPQGDEGSWNVPREEVEVTEEIGRGGWGLILKGRFRGQPVAVKKAFREILQQPYTIHQMKREIQIMASVQHPNLVRFVAAVIDDRVERGVETPLLVVELLDMDLRHAYSTMDLGTARVSIFRDVAYALHYLHEHQEPIIHRDVSAPNVLLESLQGGSYRAKLSDFGSANKVKDSRTAAPGAICYTAPEVFPPADPDAQLPPQTPKVDVFSYGVLLAEVITKTMPTTENRRYLFRQVQGKWQLMYDLIISCTKPHPSDRPTMASILNTLNRIPTPRPRNRV